MAATNDGRGLDQGLRLYYDTITPNINPLIIMAENIFIDRNDLCTQSKKALSAERISTYMEQNESDEFNAIARYLWNISLCEALYPTLQCFEIVLRNAISNSLSVNYRSDWLHQERYRLRDNEICVIEDAEAGLLRQGKTQNGHTAEMGRLVAELSLGFWTGLFVRHYDKTFAAPAIRLGLRGFPDTIRNRQALYDRFEKVRHLRNRVFHHEPIYHWQDLPQRHRDIVSYIGYISPTKQKLNGLLDRFDAVHTQGWKHYRTRIGDEILKPKPPATTPENQP